MVWWNSRSISPLSFPSKWRQESWRYGEEVSSQKVNNGGERECQRLWNHWRRKLLKYVNQISNRYVQKRAGAILPDFSRKYRVTRMILGTQTNSVPDSQNTFPEVGSVLPTLVRTTGLKSNTSGPVENCRNTNTKTTISFASGLRFWWSKRIYRETSYSNKWG